MIILFINTFSIHQVKSDKVKGKHCIEVKHWCLKVILKSLLTMFLLAQKVCLSLMFWLLVLGICLSSNSNFEKFVMRQANMVAHIIARAAISWTSHYIFDFLPPCIDQYLTNDKLFLV